MWHLLQFSRPPQEPAPGSVPRYRDWAILLYSITLAVLANWAAPRWSTTDPVFLIAVGLPAMLVARNAVGRTVGAVIALTGSIWLLFLAAR